MAGTAVLVASQQLTERMLDLTLDSPAVGRQKVRLLLPAGHDPRNDARWPLLYLLHGADDDHTGWTRETDVAELTADTGVIVVMPAAGDRGYYSDWYNGGLGGRPMWETFHLAELRALLERKFRAGPDAVVAGLSMGGFGAISYLGRHPRMFKAAASFSGVLHTLLPRLEGEFDPATWGSLADHRENWEAHDPVSLAPALSGKPLYVAWGNGEPGPLDADDAEIDDVEASIAGLNEIFVARLEELGIAATVNDYGAGTHSWPYYERELHAAMPMLLGALAA